MTTRDSSHSPAAEPACHTAEPACHIVALHGWGSDSRCWQPLIQQLPSHYTWQCIDLPGFGRNAQAELPSLAQWLQQLERELPQKCLVLGWSLGGMLALRLAASSRVSAVVTLACNAKFIAAADWPRAMAEESYGRFRDDFSAAPEATLQRFFSLQAMGDAKRRAVSEGLQQSSAYTVPGHAAWQRALDILAALDNREHFRQLQLPGLHIFGANDALVPAAVSEDLAALNSRQSFYSIPGAGHAPHISHPQQIAQALQQFIQRQGLARESARAREKQAIANNFSRAARGYEGVARLQKQVQQQLLGHARRHSVPEGPIVDLGCGTGAALAPLQQQFAAQPVYGLDFASGMLAEARRAQEGSLLRADIEQMPFQSNALALCFSSLSVQWCRGETFLRELHRVLMPGGLALFATLGPKTLFELKLSWRNLDNSEHVNALQSFSWLKEAVKRRGFLDVQSEQQYRVLYYPSVRELMAELKGIGARNIHPGRPRGLNGRRQFAKLEKHYANSFAKDGKIPATYEVLYFALRKSL